MMFLHMTNPTYNPYVIAPDIPARQTIPEYRRSRDPHPYGIIARASRMRALKRRVIAGIA